MSTFSISPHRLSWPRTKYLLFGFIGLMVAYVLRHNEHFLIDPKDPVWQHYQLSSGGFCRTVWPVHACFCSVRCNFLIVCASVLQGSIASSDVFISLVFSPLRRSAFTYSISRSGRGYAFV